MAITLTITDAQDTKTYDVLVSPVVSSPVINERNVETLDGNISTYYSSTKQSITVQLGYLTAMQYASIKAFRDRQYTNLKYPIITISGAQNLQISNMTAKMTLSDQNIVCQCGVVEGVTLNFRESKQI